MLRVDPVILEGVVARLEPLAPAHAADLFAAAHDASTWAYMPADPSASVAAISAWIAEALGQREAGGQMPFAIIERASGRAVGSSRYLNIMAHDRGLEIGWTWLAPAVRRTAVNTECKYLLLRHAFEELGTIRVQLKTDRRNEVSQRAIERLGAVREGILRQHMIVRDGYQRDSVMYSIIASEWPAVRARLEAWLPHA
ncbi:MAG TPA: GNAT family protein [Ktedonobacterales bacterium]|jgi:RimJ/RimL family protein N-acetyltransferase